MSAQSMTPRGFRFVWWPVQVALLLLLVGVLAWPTPIVPTAYADNPTFGVDVPFGNARGNARALAAGDIDGDGDLDMIAGFDDLQGVIALNSGTGTFPAGPLDCDHPNIRCFGWVSAGTSSLALGDLNGDGHLDLVQGSNDDPDDFTNDGQNVVFLNDGTGGFYVGPRTCTAAGRVLCFGTGADQSESVALGDINADGALDIAVGNEGTQSAVYLNNGGQFHQGPVNCANPALRCFGRPATDRTQAVAIGDLDGDGHLDIAAGNNGQQSRVFLNDGAGNFQQGAFTCDPAARVRCFGPANDPTASLAMGDLDGDGNFDLVTGNSLQPMRIYLNRGGSFPTGSVTCATPDVRCLGEGRNDTRHLELGDIDADGDLDIARAHFDAQSEVFLNQGEAGFTTIPFGGPRVFTLGVALADVDGDGDLDVASGTGSQQNQVFLNNGAGSFPPGSAFGDANQATLGLAVGDLNGDNHLDFVAANMIVPSRAYFNDGSGGFTEQVLTGGDDRFYTVALGDLDGDNDLDLVGGGFVRDGRSWPSQVLHNQNGGFTSVQTIGTAATPYVYDLALGDLDGDSDLDLVTASYQDTRLLGGPSQIFFNDGTGKFGPPRDLSTADTRSVALGDLDGDGDLDLVQGNFRERGAIYLNNGLGELRRVSQFGLGNERTSSVALGDIDSDGDLDLAVGNIVRQNYALLNNGQGVFANPQRFGTGTDSTRSLVMGDIDGDGDLDIVIGNDAQQSAVALNDGMGTFSALRSFGGPTPRTQRVALGDLDGDGDLDIVRANDLQAGAISFNPLDSPALLPDSISRVRIFPPGPTHSAAFFSTPVIRAEQIIPISYRLIDPQGDPVRFVRAFYSPDGGGRWLPALPTSDTMTRNLATNANYVYNWDVFASGFFGQSDQLVLQIEAYPAHAAPGSIQRPYASSVTFPFRVRGTQVRVLDENRRPVRDALVYRLPAGSSQGAQPLARPDGTPFRTDSRGYLEGRGQLQAGDRLAALQPVDDNERFTLYHTSATPTEDGLTLDTVTAGGVQELIVGPDRPLLLFHLNVSLEWDARRDRQFLAQLDFGLRRASEALYDWSNGQIALGNVTIAHDRAGWDEAQLRIYASNRLRPNAALGGIVLDDRADPQRPELIYRPGHIRMGPLWNRFGDAGATIGEDWARTLAHELGHYALFLDDNYLGFDAEGRIISVDGCPGAMSDPYRDDNSEFHPAAGWDQRCAATLANQITGRSDWETITAFYRALQVPPPENSGPGSLPLAVTQIGFAATDAPETTLEAPIFYLTHRGGRYEAGPGARAILYQEGRLIDLGRPRLDQVDARGARPGDWLCVYEQDRRLTGCIQIQTDGERIALQEPADWRPDLMITPSSSRTVNLSVAGLAAGLNLSARLYPEGETPPVAISLTRDGATGNYKGTLNLAAPVFGGYIQLWAGSEHGPRELVTDYTLGGSPGRIWKRNAPATSGDGLALLYIRNPNFPEGTFYTIQTAVPPPPPAWATPVGRAYRLSQSQGAPNLRDASLNISYLAAEVPPGQEQDLRVYFWNGQTWRGLETRRDPWRNEASAAVQGPGLYILMSSIEIPLPIAGWNLIAYPARESRPVTEALAGIAGDYTTVYGYNLRDTADPWKVYDIDAPAWANDLSNLEDGRGYWLRTIRPTTLPIRGDPSALITPEQARQGMPQRPATFYGQIRPGEGFTPGTGLEVTARIGERVCGRTRTRLVGEQVVYALDVPGDDGGAAAGCGAANRSITFSIDGRLAAESAAWESDRPQRLNLSLRTHTRVRLYLPLLRK